MVATIGACRKGCASTWGQRDGRSVAWLLAGVSQVSGFDNDCLRVNLRPLGISQEKVYDSRASQLACGEAS